VSDKDSEAAVARETEQETKSVDNQTEPESADSPVQNEAVIAPAAPVKKAGSGVVAWLALLLVLALAGAAAWSFQQLQQREAQLIKRMAKTEQVAASKTDNSADFKALEDKWQRELRDSQSAMEKTLAQRGRQQEQALQRFEAALAQQGAELQRFSANDRKAWLLAEAEYLLRLANQRLVMATDVVSAQALLASADSILVELDDPSLYEARAAVAADLAAVRAVPRVDVQGVYLSLAALVEQADKLVIFQLPDAEEQPEVAAEETWQARLEQGYEEALGKLSDYVIIRRRDVPMQALMDPQWEGLVRQNLRMLLEQAQVALLSSNQLLYRESLERAGYWVAEFFESDEAASRAMAREISDLQAREVAVTLPDLSRSLTALDQAITKRLQAGGAG
jgi:uroporphyrin-3 C-methyltransferase